MVNCAARHGATALMWAALSGHMQAIELLITAGADLAAKSSSG
jgi:ankyrin repeat protein